MYYMYVSVIWFEHIFIVKIQLGLAQVPLLRPPSPNTKMCTQHNKGHGIEMAVYIFAFDMHIISNVVQVVLRSVKSFQCFWYKPM